VYWSKDQTQVVCGCFKGTVEEFKIQVVKTHGETVHAQNYLKFIEKVLIYKN
jgi:hypothetical protein